MKVHPQIISQNGMPAFVVLPYEDYEAILDALENVEDIEAIEESKNDNSERFPLELVERIATGENAIKVFREYRGISQIQLAKQVSVSRQYISQIEHNDRAGTTRILKSIAKILHVELDDIV
jgi:DNA-binding XRE family transcriptional regulator